MMDEGKVEFPTFSSEVSEEEKSLSLEKKIQLIDNEIRKLYEFCQKAGYTELQIERCAQPLLDLQNRDTHIKWLRTLFSFAVIVALIAFLFAYDPTYRQICIHGKFLAMKALPYWDWTKMYEQDCIIENPYFVEEALSEEDCDTCKNLTTIQRLSNITQGRMADDYLFSSVPVIVTDATDDWEAIAKFDVNFLAELYESNELLRTSEGGQFQSTVEQYVNHHQILSAAKTGDVKSFQTFWENTGKEAAKVFRKYYRRPYFLPPMTEATEGNWFIVSSSASKSLSVTWECSATWIAQVRGSAKFTLKPNEVCKDSCKIIAVTLNPGEILTVPNAMWSVVYKPVSEGTVITFGSGVTWD